MSEKCVQCHNYLPKVFSEGKIKTTADTHSHSGRCCSCAKCKNSGSELDRSHRAMFTQDLIRR